MTQWLLEEAALVALDVAEARVVDTFDEDAERMARLTEMARNATRPH